MDSTYKNIIKERIQQYGISALVDAEALSLITGIAVTDLQKGIESYGLAELINYKESLNVSKAQLKKLELIYFLAKRISLAEYKEKLILNNPIKAGEYFVKQLQFSNVEKFLVCLLDSQNRLISTDVLFTGTINEAAVYPRELIKLALNKNANSVIVSHNHPGGSLSASSQDISLTNKINTALKTVNIKLVDHIIVAEDKYISLAQSALIT